MRKLITAVLIACAAWTGGCAEIRETNRLFAIMLIELFRLPVYCMKIPFQLLQNLGPIIQSSARTAANLAPLLLFIENRTAPEPRYELERGLPVTGEEIDLALRGEGAVPLLSLLESEMERRGERRFILVDARVLREPRAREAFVAALGGGGGIERCVPVTAGDIFSESDRFIRICRRMRERGDSLLALTGFNEHLSALTGTPPDVIPPDSGGRRIITRWNAAMRAGESDKSG